MHVCTVVLVRRRNRLSQPLQAVDHGDQNVVAAACAQLVEHLEPELGSLGLLDPNPQNLARAVGQHPQSEVDGLVPHHRVVADLHPQAIEEHYRVHRLERPVLPGDHLRHHLVGDLADELGRHLGAVHLHQVALDLAHRHAARVHPNDLLVEAREAALVLAHDSRLEAARARSRGTSILTGPVSVITVFALLPLRWLVCGTGFS